MKISEVIALLKDKMEEVGDVKVTAFQHEEEPERIAEVTSVRFMERRGEILIS